MANRLPWVTSAVLALGVAAASAPPQSKPAAPPAPIVQPGAPGTATKRLAPSAVRGGAKKPLNADVSFMQGMIMHHAQAVEMVDLLRTRALSKDLRALGERISISQTDEIKYMKQWLTDRGEPTTMDMDGMDGMDMLMPGMLTAQQMKELAAAKGAEFDNLFLTGMIQHHNGALIMVDDLFSTPGAGQDAVLFDFASDIDNTQRAEINIMRAMLEKEKK